MKFLKLAAFTLCAAAASLAQTQINSTTFASAVDNQTRTITFSSAPTGVTAPFEAVADREAILVNSISGTVASVTRGWQGTKAQYHSTTVSVYYGPLGAFSSGDQTGACPYGASYSPTVALPTGNAFNCPSTGANAGQWVQQSTTMPFQFSDGAFFVPASAGYSSVSGNSTGTNGYTVAGASNTPVVQAQTSGTGTNTHTYTFVIHVPSRLTSGKGIQITDATFFYGVQSNALGTQAATLASGTMNSSTVFATISFPTAAASETPSTVTPVRADSGSLTITPAVASFNTATTTAGAFYSVKFAPASPIALNSDLQEILLTVTLQCAATTATITNSPGVLVHYIVTPL